MTCNAFSIRRGLLGLILATLHVSTGTAFLPQHSLSTQKAVHATAYESGSRLAMKGDGGGKLEETFGGYTAKQRLREEVESPFRTVRLFFFGSSTVSALVAFYFSMLSAVKSYAGYADAPPMQEAMQSIAINVIAVAVCSAITYRDWQAGESNLARIKQGGALAKLVVQRASDESDIATLSDYRRSSRVLIAAGGKEYISELCRSLNADQLADKNTLAEAIKSAEILLVPVLLQEAQADSVRVGDTSSCWKETPPYPDLDKNFDIARANEIVGFPRGPMAWAEMLEPEIKTAIGQGFDVREKGITLIIKKNGKILRRATGQPQWNGLLGTMEVLDGSKFGMPGDDEIYGTGSR